MEKIVFIVSSLVIFLNTGVNGCEPVNIEDLFGIPVTRWIFEGSDGINQYQFKNEYPKSAQFINADYGYYFNFQFPNIIEYTFATPITFQNGNILITEILRKGTFDIEENIVTINFTEIIYRIPDTFGKLSELILDYLMITMEVETDGRTELYVKQISGKNIFVENDKHKKIKFVASILPTLQ